MESSTPAESLGRFLTLADTAEILSITPAEALELVRTNELPAIKVGSAWRVERVVLESYIEGKYEESRRMGLWQGSDLGGIPELSGGRIIRPKP